MSTAPPADRGAAGPRGPVRAGALRGAVVFAGFTLLALVWTAPLGHHLDRGLPYTHAPQPGLEVVERFPGDYLQFYYHLWLFQDGLLGPTPAFTDPYEFAWDGPQPGIRTYFVPLSLVFLLLVPFGTFVAYNGLVLVSSGLAGLTMFLLAREVVGRTGPALLAGLVYAAGPYRHAVLMGGHPTGAAFFLLPLAWFGLERALRTGQARFAALAGAAVLSLPLVEPHFLYFFLLLLPPLLLARLLPVDRTAPASADTERPPWAVVVAALPVVAALGLAVALALVGRGVESGAAALVAWVVAGLGVGAVWLASGLVLARLREEPLGASLRTGLWCLAPLGLLALSPLRFVWEVSRFTSGLLAAAAALVILAHVAVLCRHRRGRARVGAAMASLRPLWPLALLGAGAIAIMLHFKQSAVDPALGRAGRSLREIALFAPSPGDWFVRFTDEAGRSLYPGIVAVALGLVGVLGARRLPDGVARRWLGFAGGLFLVAEVLSLGPNGDPFPLYRWLYELVPYFGFIRQTSKFQVLAFLALALVAAAGARVLLDAIGPRRAAAPLLAVLLGAAVADYWPARPVGVSRLPTGNAVYDVLRAPGPGQVVYVPIWPGDSSWSSLYQFAATLTRRPMVNGYSPVVSRRYVDEVYWPLDHLNRGEVTAREHARLSALGVRYLVVDRGAFPPKVSPFPSGFTLTRLRASPYVELVAEDAPLWLFRIRDAAAAPPGALPSSPVAVFLEAERLPRRVGRPVEDAEASWGRATAVAEQTGAEAGYLLLGAKVGLPRGSFRIVFRLRGRGPAGDAVARVDAVADGGRRVLATRVLAGRELGAEFADYALAVALAEPEWIELRVHWEGRGALAADYVYGLFADQTDPPRVFENDEFAFGYGPYRRFPPGDYELRFRTRVDARRPEAAVRFAVVTAHERAPIAARTVRGDELARAGAYEEVTLPVRVDRLRALEILIDFLAPGVSVDRITVTPRP